jgi:ribonuclease E
LAGKTAKKKATTKKKASKKKTRRKATGKEAPESETAAQDTATQAESTTGSGTAAAPAAKKRTARKTSTRKKTAKATKKTVRKRTNVSEAKAEAEPGTPAAGAKEQKKRTRKRRKAKSAASKPVEKRATGPEIAEENGQIIIRFPPAAPPPFPARSALPEVDTPSDEPLAVEEEVMPEATQRTGIEAQAVEWIDEAAEDEMLEPEATEVAEASAPVAEAAPPAEVAEKEAEEALTPSKKRRLRRRRQRHKRDTEPRGDRKPKAESDEIEEDPTPWLAAAESIKAQLSDTEPAAPEAEAEALEAEAAEAPPREVEETEEEAAEEAPAKGKVKRRRRRGRRSSRHEAGEQEDVAPRVKRGAPGMVAEVEAKARAAPPKTTEKVMVINAIPREECRIAVLYQGRLEEIYLERATFENHVGNIYKGVVTNVEASIQAAFVDFGQGKNGFLHISDLHPRYFPDGNAQTENVGHKLPRRNRPPIQKCLRRNQEVIVQVTKEGIGTKGPTLSTYLSIPGRFLVMMPGMGRLGVSRRIEDDDSRDKLRKQLSELELPNDMGFIARTAALDRTKRELQGDLTYLTRLWRAVEKRIKQEPPPAELYRESDLVIRTIRDVFSNDIERILVDDPDVSARAREFLSIFSPRSADIVTAYSDPVPIFHKYGIEEELERLHSRRVPLRSGGSLVIDQTEALVAIDVNSGRFRTEDDAEATAFKINSEAADEIARQLRLRDLGGVVVCDFIDMRQESHRREIERRLARNLKEHKERAKVLRTSQFGIIELTRQRQRASLTHSIYQDCRHCRGSGLVKTVESVALDVMRLIQLAVTRDRIHTIEVSVSPDVAFLLQNRKRRLIHDLESKNRRVISIRPEPSFSLDQVVIRCTDPRGRLVPHN